MLCYKTYAFKFLHYNNSKKIYKLTVKGIDLLPLLTEAILWSAKYDKQTAADIRFMRMAKKQRESLFVEIRERLK